MIAVTDLDGVINRLPLSVIPILRSGSSASKIAHCSLAQDQGVGLISGLKLEGDYLEEANGYAAHLGAICVEVEGYCDVYVCVSGAKQEEDLECAKEAIKVIVDFFNNQGKFKINVPVFLTEGGER